MSAAAASRVPLLATAAVFALLYGACALRYEGFASWYQLAALLGDNATLGLVAIGMTFVILSGGIDLSVGALLALASMATAALVVDAGLPLAAAVPCVLAGGLAFGAGSGALVAFCRLPAFLVTLAGMFLARGLALGTFGEQRISVSGHPAWQRLGTFAAGGLTLPALAFVAAAVLAVVAARWTRFGRSVYAVGGNADAALRAGVRVRRVEVGVYAASGLLAASAGVVHVLGTGAGDASAAYAMELDAIAAVVIGGTLLRGGSGHVGGTALGVLILGVLATVPSYQGDLSSWWIRIAVGGLLLVFVLLQRLVQQRLGVA